MSSNIFVCEIHGDKTDLLCDLCRKADLMREIGSIASDCRDLGMSDEQIKELLMPLVKTAPEVIN